MFICERCNGSDDVAMIYVNDIPKTYCSKCRTELFVRKKPVGRPAVGITKKVSLTLPEDEWTQLDKRAQGNRSSYLRQLVRNDLQS